MKNSKEQIKEGLKMLDIMKYMLDTNQHEYIAILTDDDYLEIDQLICKGTNKDLAISHVAIMRKFKKFNIKPRMKCIKCGGSNEDTFDLRILNKDLLKR